MTKLPSGFRTNSTRSQAGSRSSAIFALSGSRSSREIDQADQLPGGNQFQVAKISALIVGLGGKMPGFEHERLSGSLRHGENGVFLSGRQVFENYLALLIRNGPTALMK